MDERRDDLVQQAFRFALTPTRAQEKSLVSWCGASRFWFNQGLALVKNRLDRRAAGEEVAVPWSYRSLCTAFRGNEVKDALAPWRSEVVAGSTHRRREFSRTWPAPDGSRKIARGGQVSLVPLDEHSPVKREESQDSSQGRETLAVAA